MASACFARRWAVVVNVPELAPSPKASEQVAVVLVGIHSSGLSWMKTNNFLYFFWSMLKIKISISIQRDEDLADQHFQLQLTSFCFRTSLALGRELFKGALRIARWTLVFCCAMMGKPKNTCRSDRVMREFREKLTCGRKFKIEIKDYRIISVTLQ